MVTLIPQKDSFLSGSRTRFWTVMLGDQNLGNVAKNDRAFAPWTFLSKDRQTHLVCNSKVALLAELNP